MIVGIERGLEGIKNFLEGLQNYEIYYLDQYDGPMDAIVYNHNSSTSYFEHYQFESISNALEDNADITKGTLMIKATHKTPEDVKELLEARFTNE